jgi:hypothetical protein
MEKCIVCVHGRAQDWEIKDALQRHWRDALRFGVERSGTEPLLLTDDQIILAHYGDLFRPDGYEGSKGGFQQEEEDSFTEGLAELFIQEAEKREQIDRAILEQNLDEVGGTVEKGLVANIKPVLRILDKVPGFSGFVLSRFIKDVNQYLNHHAFRQSVIERVVTALQHCQGKEVIVVAHSLGTVVAYNAINTHPEFPISAFLTLGSPLGIATYIFQRLLTDAQQLRSFPESITGNWNNFYDEDDIVALTHDLAPFFPRDDKPVIESIQVYNGRNHHSLNDYLSSKAVGRVVRAAFREN